MLRQTERDQARRLILDGYSIDEVVKIFSDGPDEDQPTRAWAYGIAQEIKNERRRLQAAQFRAYHLRQEG